VYDIIAQRNKVRRWRFSERQRRYPPSDQAIALRRTSAWAQRVRLPSGVPQTGHIWPRPACFEYRGFQKACIRGSSILSSGALLADAFAFRGTSSRTGRIGKNLEKHGTVCAVHHRTSNVPRGRADGI